MKKVAGPLKLDLAQYRALAAFAQFASDLDKATRDQLTRGEKLSEVVKQPQYQPLGVEKQVAILYAATTGALDDVPTPRVREWEAGFYRFLEGERPKILTELAETEDDDRRARRGLRRGDRRVSPELRRLIEMNGAIGRSGGPGQGGAEHASERTPGCVSERAQATTRSWIRSQRPPLGRPHG